MTPPSLLTEDENARLKHLASSCAPSEWAQARHAAEILKCHQQGVLPSPEAINWFMAFREKAR